MRISRRLTIIGVVVASGIVSADTSRHAEAERACRSRLPDPSCGSVAAVDEAFEGRMAWPAPVRPPRASRADGVKAVVIEPLGILVKDSHRPGARRSDAPRGVLVADVTEGGVADGCGLCVGDRILRVDGALVSTADGVSKALQARLADSHVSLTIIHPRDEEEVVLDVRLM